MREFLLEIVLELIDFGSQGSGQDGVVGYQLGISKSHNSSQTLIEGSFNSFAMAVADSIVVRNGEQ